MKYLLVFLVLALAYWFWRSTRTKDQLERQRRDGSPLQKNSQAPSNAPVTMVQCAACGIHLPSVDATIGKIGAFYCSVEHRTQARD